MLKICDTLGLPKDFLADEDRYFDNSGQNY